MGNICCQNDVDKSFIEDNILKMDQYQSSTLPLDDKVLDEWFKLNNITLPTTDSPSPGQVMKHKLKQRYYYGEWRDGVPEGKGVFYEPKKILFNGNFANGLPAGVARIVFIDQMCEFDGQLKQGKANGNGSLENMKNKFKFSGQWKDSKPQKGTLTFAADKNISNIEFEDFQKRRAVINYKDQRRYEGEINTNKLEPNGKGKVQFPFQSNKAFYDGEWHNGQMQGRGIFKWTDGSQYDGEFAKSKKQGFGKFLFSNGNYYEGYWVDGKQEGAGTLYSKQNQVLKKGSWKNGVFTTVLDKENWQSQQKQSAIKRDKVLSDIKAQQQYQAKNEKLQSSMKRENERSEIINEAIPSSIKKQEININSDIKVQQPQEAGLNGSHKPDNTII